MFTKSQNEAALDAEIASALETLSEIQDKTSEKYGKLVEQISKLYELKTDKRSKPLSPDTMLIVAANIFGILWLTRFEQENVIKSRSALGFVMRPPVSR